MSLATQLVNLATRIGTEFKAVRTLVNGNSADLSALTTSSKSNLVSAINEVKASIGASGATINDTTPSTTQTYSSSKTNSQIASAVSSLVNGSPAALDTLKEFSDALGGDANFATSTATSLGNRLRLDAAQTLTSGQQTQGRTNLDTYGTSQIGDPATDFVSSFVAALS